MKRACLSVRVHLLTFIVGVIAILSFSPGLSQDIVIGIFDGTNTNVSSSFSGGVTTFTPSGTPSQLNRDALNAALAAGNVVIEAAAGSVIFTPGTFDPSTANRTLTLKAGSDIQLSFYTGSVNLIHINAEAEGHFTTYGNGVRTAGGNVEIHAYNVTINNQGLSSGGGDVDIHAKNICLIKGTGLKSGGGNVRIYAKNVLNVGDPAAHGEGVSTSGGNFTGETHGMFNVYGTGIKSNGGKVILQASDEVFIIADGIQSAGGDVEIYTNDILDVNGRGISSSNGHIKIKANILDIANEGINSGTGDIWITTRYNVNSTGTGIITNNGNVSIKASAVSFFDTGLQAGSGGHVKLDIGFGIYVSGGGIRAASYYSTGFDFTTLYGGLYIFGGPVDILHYGDFNIMGEGIWTNGGKYTSTGKSWMISGTGIRSGDGNVSLCHEGDVVINSGGIQSGTGTVSVNSTGAVSLSQTGIRTDGSDVDITASSITIDGGNVNTGFGSSTGGMLTQMEGDPGTINILIGPDLGGGSLLLNTINPVSCLEFIPTVGQWGLIYLSLAFLILGTVVIYQRKMNRQKIFG